MTEHNAKLNGSSSPAKSSGPVAVEPWPGINLDPKQLLMLYEQKDNAKLCERTLEILEYFRINNFDSYSEGQKNLLNMITKLILLLFSKQDFNIPDGYAPYFIDQNTTLSNLAVMSDYRTTDIFFREVLKQQKNFYKILFLYSERNKTPIEVENLFKIHPYLTSLWLSKLISSKWHAGREAHELMQKFFNDDYVADNYVISDKDFPVQEEPCFAFFHSTYASPGNDSKIRSAINKRIRKDFAYELQLNKPDFDKILVISGSLTKGHAVYKSINPLLYSLKGKYQLDLFHLSTKEGTFDTELFDNVKMIDVDSKTGGFTIETLQQYLKESYGTIIFTDIGLNRPSLILANLRMAPIQITTYGHPVSSDGAEIDYYISGKAVEKIQNPEENYSERLVLIPGLATMPVYPDYSRSNSKKSQDSIHISCSWGNQKFNYPHLLTLKRILEKSKKKAVFNFIGMSAENMMLFAAEQELSEILGKDNITLNKQTDYTSYMNHIESCHIGIDSYPFGSYNRIIDTLFCGVPIITLEGDKAYNRLASAILRELGLDELIAVSEDEYIEKTVRLIDDETYRKKITAKVESVDLKKKLISSGNEKYFRKAIDFLVENHEKLKTDKSRKPVIIK